MQCAIYPAISPGYRPTLHRPALRKRCHVGFVLWRLSWLESYLDPLGPRNHNKNTTSVHYRRLALQRNRAMYIAAFVFGHDVDSYFLRTLENAAYIQSYRLDVRVHWLIWNENWKWKWRLLNMKYEQLERRTLMNQSSTFLCPHIVKRPTTYVFANAYSI